MLDMSEVGIETRPDFVYSSNILDLPSNHEQSASARYLYRPSWPRQEKKIDCGVTMRILQEERAGIVEPQPQP